MIIKANENNQEKQGTIINAIGDIKDLKIVECYANELGRFCVMFINNEGILDFETEYEKLHRGEKFQQYFIIEVNLNDNAIVKSYIQTTDYDGKNVINIQELDVKYSEQEKRVIQTFINKNF